MKSKVSFKNFLIEDSAYDSVNKTPAKNTTTEIEKFIASHYKDYSDAIDLYVDRKIALYRGVEEAAALFVSGHNDVIRKSANSTNHYNILFSETLDSWNSYPKRNRSLIGSTYQDGVAGYGVCYTVFPKNKSAIGICSSADFWVSFENGLSNLADTKYRTILIKFIKEKYDDALDKKLKTDWQSALSFSVRDNLSHFNKKIELFGSITGMKDPTKKGSPLMNFKLSSGETVYEIFNKIFSPKENGFEIVTNVSHINTSEEHEREFWTQESALMFATHCPDRYHIISCLKNAKENHKK